MLPTRRNRMNPPTKIPIPPIMLSVRKKKTTVPFSSSPPELNMERTLSLLEERVPNIRIGIRSFKLTQTDSFSRGDPSAPELILICRTINILCITDPFRRQKEKKIFILKHPPPRPAGRLFYKPEQEPPSLRSDPACHPQTDFDIACP